MTTTANQLPNVIFAQVHEDAINRVSRFFNATTFETLGEIFQNCRRAGASKVDVTIQDGVVTVTDDGAGISNPQLLLSFGQAGWEDSNAQREDPAGMGFYALSRYQDITVESHCVDQGIAWQVSLQAEHFLGKQVANVTALSPGTQTGTTIKFADPKAELADVEAAAIYYPLPVTCNGEPVKQVDYLADATYIEEWQGIRIGVFTTGPRPNHDKHPHTSINFHGVTIQHQLPQVQTIANRYWQTAVDVIDCPDLELVLPARREVVQNRFTAELRTACERAIYRAILASGQQVDLAYQDHAAAEFFGINLPQAQPTLQRWLPEVANWIQDQDRASAPRQPIQPEAVIIGEDSITVVDQQALYLAAETAGMDQNLWREDQRLIGYPWYDQIPIVRQVQITIADTGTEHVLHDYHGIRHYVEPCRPDAVTFTLRPKHADGSYSTITIPAQVVLNEEEIYSADDPGMFVVKDTTLSPHDLTDMMVQAYFVPSDDYEADSVESQQYYWENEFHKIATELLESKEAAMLQAIAQAVSTYVAYEVQPGYTVNIQLERGKAPQITATPTNADAS